MCQLISYKKIIILAACLLLSGIGWAEENGEDSSDSTTARDRTAPKPSLGEILLTLPGEILKLPVYAVEGLTYGGVYLATESPLRRAFNFGNPVSPFYPVAGFSSNQGLKGGGGVNFYQLFSADDRLKFKASHSTHNYQSYRVKYDRSNLLISLEYKKRPRENFYGLGNFTVEADEVNFTLERTRLSARLSRRIRGGLSHAGTEQFQLVGIEHKD